MGLPSLGPPSDAQGDALQLGESIGEGAHSVVLAAKYGEHEVAVKRSHRVAAERSEATRNRFRREAAALARVAHEGLVRGHQMGNDEEGRPYVVMERVHGQTLQARLSGGAMPVAEVLSLGRRVAETLGAVHRAGLIHRDVKPSNILLTEAGEPKLIDFGLAADSRGAASREALVGTFLYAAPEQTGALTLRVDERADLYALGVVLFECLGGHTPFEASTLDELIRLHAAKRAPRLRELRPEVPEALEELVAALLAKDPDDRYVSASAVAADLGRIADDPALPAHALRRGVASAVRGELPPLIGRAEAVGKLLGQLQEASEGRGSLVAVTGPFGHGKTRVLQELAKRAEGGGALVFWGRQAAGEALPLAPFKAMVADYASRLSRMGEDRQARWRLRAYEAAGDYAPFLVESFPTLRGALGTNVQPSIDAGQEIHYDAIAQLLCGLGDKGAPCVVVVENADALDAASMHVLRRLARRASSGPLMVVCTGESANTATHLQATLGVSPGLHVELGALDEAAVAEFVQSYLATPSADTSLVAELMLRSRGVPLAVVEHLRAMLEAGALVPSWGSWRLDRTKLESLHLSADAVGLMVDRLGELPEEATRVLTAASLVGMPFDANLLQDMLQAESDDVFDALQQAAAANIIENREGATYTFTVEALRQTLADRWTAQEQVQLRRRAAAVLAERMDADERALFACARQHMQSVHEESAQTAHDVLVRAGQAALDAHGPGDAVEFLQGANVIAKKYGLTRGFGLFDALAAGYALSGQVDKSLRATDKAVERCEDPIRKAWLLLRAAQLALGANFDSRTARANLEAAWASAGMAMPRNRPGMLLHAPWDLMRGLWIDTFGLAFTPDARKQQLRYALVEETVKLAYFENHIFVLIGWMFRTFLVGLMCGRPRERSYAYAAIASTLGVFGMPPRVYARFEAKARRTAEEASDTVARTRVRMLALMAMDLRGELKHTVQLTEDFLAENFRWLSVADVFMTHLNLSMNYGVRGYSTEGANVMRRCKERLSEVAGADASDVQMCEDMIVATESTVSRPAAMGALVEKNLQKAGGPENGFMWFQACTLRVGLVMGTEDLSAADDAIEQTELANRNPMINGWQMSSFWYLKAMIRLAQGMATEPGSEERTLRLKQLKEAHTELRFLKGTPCMLAGAMVIEAGHHYLSGDVQRALQRLNDAELVANDADAPIVNFEAKKTRGRILREIGESAAGLRELRGALLLAEQLQWPARAERMRREIGAPTASRSSLDHTGSHFTATASHTMGSGSAKTSLLQRDRDALLEVSLASASRFEPREQARAALDKLVRILGAERAFLLLVDEETSELSLLAGRDSERRDLADKRLPTKVLTRVRDTRTPVVLSGVEEGLDQGFTGVFELGLRSLICAPLMLRQKLTGVVYLDSSLARGVFSESDLDILRAIANQIAVSQETARSAQREIQRREMEKDYQLTAAVQSLLLPKQDVWVGDGVGFAAFYEPATQASGDWWHAHELPDGALRVLLGDVTGHGAGSAMVTALVAGCHRCLKEAQAAGSAEDLLRQLHEAVLDLCQGSYTMPMGLLDLHPGTGLVRFWNAAGPPLLVRRKSGEVEAKTLRGTPLGSERHAAGHLEFTLQPGERLLLFTDGIPELSLPSGNDLGLRRMARYFSEEGGGALQQARAGFIQRVREALEDGEADDDLTFIVVERSADA